MDPQETIRLLDELVALGFSNEAFHVLHHFRTEATIHAHRVYCEATRSFTANSNNELVQKRLRLVRDAYKDGGFMSGNPQVFVALAEAACRKLPEK